MLSLSKRCEWLFSVLYPLSNFTRQAGDSKASPYRSDKAPGLPYLTSTRGSLCSLVRGSGRGRRWGSQSSVGNIWFPNLCVRIVICFPPAQCPNRRRVPLTFPVKVCIVFSSCLLVMITRPPAGGIDHML